MSIPVYFLLARSKR